MGVRVVVARQEVSLAGHVGADQGDHWPARELPGRVLDLLDPDRERRRAA